MMRLCKVWLMDWSRTQSNQDDAVRRYRRLELSFKLTEVFLPPEVADDLLATNAKVRPLRRRGCLDPAAIKQTHSLAAVLYFFGPDFEVAVLAHAVARLAERVLVHFDHFIIAKEAQREIVEPSDVAAQDERRTQQTPE